MKVIASGWRDIFGVFNPGIVSSDANANEKALSTWRTEEARARRKELNKLVMAEATKCAKHPKYQGWKRNDIKAHLKSEVFADHIFAKSGKEDVHYGYIPIEMMTPYAGLDTFITQKLFYYILDRMPLEGKIASLYDNEMRLSQVIMETEEHGMKIDRAYLEKMALDYERDSATLAASIDAYFVEKLPPILDENGEQLLNEAGQPVLPTVLLSSPEQLGDALVAVGVPLRAKSKNGNWVVDKGTLLKHEKKFPIVKDILELRRMQKLKSTYFDAILTKLVDGDILHANFNQNVSTGRMCIAKGSLVQLPCNRAVYPNGKPIEDIVVGDQVYCYDSEGTLHLRKVLWSGSKGIKSTVKIFWKGQGNKHTGELQLTPDHRVRLFDGSWIEAQNLKPGDRIMALSSGFKGRAEDRYPYLYGRYSEIREHRFAASEFFGSDSDVIHHIDGNKYNNELSNLEQMSFSEHAREHNSKLSLEELKKRGSSFHTIEAIRKRRESIKYGAEHHCWKDIPRYTLLKWAALCSGSPTKIAKLAKLDFETVKKKYSLEGIDLALVRKRYNPSGVYLSKRIIREASEISGSRSYKSLGIGFYAFKDLLSLYKLETNHVVVSVETSNEVEVFDLEVEEYNNFIANELCVHNSSNDPNLQNQPRGNAVRNAFICPSDDYIYLFADYSQIEVRLTAHFSQDAILLDSYRRNQDVHCRTAGAMFGVSYEEMVEAYKSSDKTNERVVLLKNYRNIGKTLNFAMVYGVSAQGLSEQIPRPPQYSHYSEDQWVAECEKFIKSYFHTHVGVKRFINKYSREIKSNCYIENDFGRIRHLPHAQACKIMDDHSLGWMERRAQRQGVNFLVQGTAGDLFKTAVVRVHKLLEGKKSYIVNFVHDEIQIYLHKEELYLLKDIRHAMQDFKYKVPIIADFSWSKTSWGDKKDI